MPAQTLERLSQIGERIRSIRGNGDREVVMVFDNQSLPATVPERVREETRWVADQLTRSQRDFLAGLPEQLVFQIEKLGSVLFCHATPRNDEEIFTPLTPEERLRVIFSNVRQEIVVCGHTHMQFELDAGDVHILNAGSVGMPFADKPGAYWLLLTPDGYEFRRTDYDGEAAAQAIRASGNPQAHEFAEENILKVPSASEVAALFERLASKSPTDTGQA